MKVALLQLDPTVGALKKNAEALRDAARRAAEAGAELAVASELVVTGYPPRDLLEREGFVSATERANAAIVEDVPEGLTLIFGTVGRTGARALTNDAVVAQRGRIIARASKRLLPTYDVFDEARHFVPGREDTIVTVGEIRVAITVCEDAWGWTERLAHRYGFDPLEAVGPERVDLLVNLSASPFTLDKLENRPRLFTQIARERGVPVLLVNQVGGNDELIFDGRSVLIDASGTIRARARAFAEDVLVVDLDGESGRMEPEPSSRIEAAHRALVLGLGDYARKCGFPAALVGLSGGIDSAVTACIAVEALGPARVLGVAMPTRYSSEGSLADARALASSLGIRLELIDIDPIFQSYIDHLTPALERLSPARTGDVTFENLQARVRGATLMALSNREGALVLTTGNKSEAAVGYSTLYGDMAGGLAVISDVPKTMVYALAHFINDERPRIPQSTLEKAPSAELRPDQKDEDSLPPYDVLDRIIEQHVEHQIDREGLVAQGFDPAIVDRTLHLIARSEYKRRQAPPGLIITSKAFGPGRRLPIAQGFDLSDS
jgi:NAD+ synthase (glutamine-hydrolysing)